MCTHNSDLCIFTSSGIKYDYFTTIKSIDVFQLHLCSMSARFLLYVSSICLSYFTHTDPCTFFHGGRRGLFILPVQCYQKVFKSNWNETAFLVYQSVHVSSDHLTCVLLRDESRNKRWRENDLSNLFVLWCLFIVNFIKYLNPSVLSWDYISIQRVKWCLKQ